MREIIVGESDVKQNMGDWEHLVNLMTNTGGDFEGATVAALPSRVHQVGSAFVAAWAGYARESADDAASVVSALQETLRDFQVTDEELGRQFKGLSIGCPAPPETGPSVAMPSLALRLGELP